MHARSQKVLSEGSNFEKFFFHFLRKNHYKRAITGPAAKPHLNGVSLAQLGSFVNFQGSVPVMVRNPILCDFLRGGGVRTPCPHPLWIRP